MANHQQHMRKRAQVAQIVAVVAAAAGAAAALIPVSGPKPTSTDTNLTIPGLPAADDSRVAILPTDVQIVAAAMNRSVEIKERYRPPEPVQTTETPDEEKPTKNSDPGPVVTSGAWQYVGTIVSPNSTAAIVNDEEGKQHFFFAGDKHNATTVVSIAPDHIMVRDGDDAPPRRVDLQPRLASLLPEASPAAFGVGPSSSLPLEFQKPPAGFDQWNPEQQQQWMERRQMIERQMAEQKARQPRPAVPNRAAPSGKQK